MFHFSKLGLINIIITQTYNFPIKVSLHLFHLARITRKSGLIVFNILKEFFGKKTVRSVHASRKAVCTQQGSEKEITVI